MPIKAKFVHDAAGQKAARWDGRRRLMKSMAEMRRVFAAERQMWERYWSVEGQEARERIMQRWRVISVAKYARWRHPFEDAEGEIVSLARLPPLVVVGVVSIRSSEGR